MDNNNKNILMLMTDISKMFHCEMRKKTDEDSKMVTYRPILHVLRCHDGCTQLDIVNYTLLKAPTISLTLTNMESDGLIYRKENTDDKRITNIYITDKGKEINEKMRILAEGLKNDFIKGISIQEQEEVKKVLLKIMKNVEKLK